MSIDLSAKVTTDVARSSNQVRPSVSPSGTAPPTVQLVGSGRQNTATGGNETAVSASETSNAVKDISALSEAVSRMSDHVQNIRRGLEFTIDKELDRTVITVYDVESEEIIRQIPSEEFLNLVRHFNEIGEGSLINEEA